MKTLEFILILFVLISLAGLIKSFIPVIKSLVSGLNFSRIFKFGLILYFVISVIRNIIVSVF